MTLVSDLTRAEKEAHLTKLLRTWPFFKPEEVDFSVTHIPKLTDEELTNHIFDMQELHEK